MSTVPSWAIRRGPTGVDLLLVLTTLASRGELEASGSCLRFGAMFNIGSVVGYECKEWRRELFVGL